MKLINYISFNDFYSNVKDAKLPLRLSYKLARLMDLTGKQVEFYQDHFRKILNEYIVKEEDGNYKFTEDGTSVVIIPGKQEECNAELLKLQNLEVEDPTLFLTEDDLDAFSSIEMSVEQVEAIMPFIK